MAQRLWLLRVVPNAERDLRELPDKQRPAVLDSIEELICAVNPLRIPHIRNVKGRPGIWRRRAGRWRIFFELNSATPEGTTEYKGTLIILAVSLRDKDTYR